jgi:hypothetical protein
MTSRVLEYTINKNIGKIYEHGTHKSKIIQNSRITEENASISIFFIGVKYYQ